MRSVFTRCCLRDSKAIKLLLIVLIALLSPYAYPQGRDVDVYIARVYAADNFTVFLGDIQSVLSSREYLGLKIVGGFIREIAMSDSMGLARLLIYGSVAPLPNNQSGLYLYEYGGYYLKAYRGSLSIQTAVLQGRKMFLHTICTDSNFTLELHILNKSIAKFHSLADIDVVTVSTDGLYVVLVSRINTSSISIENASIIKLYSRYPCLSIAGVIGRSRDEVMQVVLSTSFDQVYGYLDESREFYRTMFEVLPRVVEADFIQVKEFYYVAMYNRLNTILNPEVISSSGLDRVASFLIALKISSFSKPGFRVFLDRMLQMMGYENSSEVYTGLRIAKALGYDRDAELLCHRLKELSPGEGVEQVFYTEALKLCGAQVASSPIGLGLSSVDLLALAELGLISISKEQSVVELPTPSSSWSCLAYSQGLRQVKAQLGGVIHKLTTEAGYCLCLDYIVLSALAGLKLEDGLLVVRPYIPMPMRSLELEVNILGASITINYTGWGDIVRRVRVDGVAIDMNTIELSTILRGVRKIDVELLGGSIAVDIVVLNRGEPLNRIPVYVDVMYGGTVYRLASITDYTGRALFNVMPNSYLIITINVSDIGFVQLRKWVGDRDESITVDMYKVFQGYSDITRSLETLSRKISDLERDLDTLKSRQQVSETSPRAWDRVSIIFSVLALFASIIALGLALLEIHRGVGGSGVGKGM